MAARTSSQGGPLLDRIRQTLERHICETSASVTTDKFVCVGITHKGRSKTSWKIEVYFDEIAQVVAEETYQGTFLQAPWWALTVKLNGRRARTENILLYNSIPKNPDMLKQLADDLTGYAESRR